jgi:hypothetical protein
MHLMILWNSAQTSKEIRKYLTVVNIFVYNAHPSCKIKNLDKILCIMHKKLWYSIISKHFMFPCVLFIYRLDCNWENWCMDVSFCNVFTLYIPSYCPLKNLDVSIFNIPMIYGFWLPFLHLQTFLIIKIII